MNLGWDTKIHGEAVMKKAHLLGAVRPAVFSMTTLSTPAKTRRKIDSYYPS
jgi:hypothetical protein